MKRVFSFILAAILALSFAGCEKKNVGNNSKSDTAAQVQKNEYSNDQILFAVRDKRGVKDDTDILYCYNYKGDLIASKKYRSNWLDDYALYYSKYGLAPTYDDSTGKVGYADKNGIFVIEPKYNSAAAFSKDGIALVEVVIETGDSYGSDYKYGYINSNGEEITPLIYDYATSFYDCGYAIAKISKYDNEKNYIGAKQYIIDKKGKVITEIDDIASGMNIDAVYDDYYVCEISENEGIIFDYSNKELSRFKTTENETEIICYSLGKHSLERLTFKLDDSFSLLKAEKFNGKKFVDASEDYAMSLIISRKRVATTYTGYGFGIEKNGKILIPFKYDHIYVYNDYYVAIRQTGENVNDQKFDIYDKNFNKTAENIDHCFDYRNSNYGNGKSHLPSGYFEIILIKENDTLCGDYGIIDYKGNIIIEPIFERDISYCVYEESGRFIYSGEFNWYDQYTREFFPLI